MRIYLPSSLAELADPDGLSPRVVHAVTPALRAALPDEDEEGLEFSAQLLAADDSLERLADAPPRRVVVAADVPEDAVAPLADDDAVPSAVQLVTAVAWDDVACAHVDEPGAAAEVTAALAGDDDAAERLVERDLLWYDVSELAALARQA
ncbi:hypothetical protein OEB99_07420 [Actinotalea sp. M2MS4P-6]|uniref:DUF6912 family protein n=1 Tax=Actinotalea sp. M2MS4P-6 TaxID=2983762 RepID=UPI0021E37650|nr:hypothetical protein [Actinotalea sp. M2MS4P-6]MCV2394131.1 hypothetical protein [Actinotalea sp. M2MS4P-6]